MTVQNKYKVNYRKDCEKIRRKKLIVNSLVTILIIVVSLTAVLTIYNIISNTGEKDVEINNGSNTNLEENDNNNNQDIIDGGNENDINNSTNTDSEQSTVVPGELDKGKNDTSEYVYGQKVPESEAVENDYFDDAVFIGNSQIEGISIYSSMNNATVYAGKGIMVDTIFSKEVIKTDDGSRITIMDALAKEQFGKVYIMLGANELGWAFDYLFIEQYGKVIDEIKKLEPSAKIYVNAIMPVTKEKSNKDKTYNNQNIDNYNSLILNMTKEKEVYYLDSKEALADAEGNLPEDAGSDGVHLNSTYYEKWFNYLKTHTVK